MGPALLTVCWQWLSPTACLCVQFVCCEAFLLGYIWVVPPLPAIQQWQPSAWLRIPGGVGMQGTATMWLSHQCGSWRVLVLLPTSAGPFGLGEDWRSWKNIVYPLPARQQSQRTAGPGRKGAQGSAVCRAELPARAMGHLEPDSMSDDQLVCGRAIKVSSTCPFFSGESALCSLTLWHTSCCW